VLAFFSYTTFDHCLSREVGGTLSLIGIIDATSRNCQLINCSAGNTGGAIGSVSSNLLIFNSFFLNCRVGAALPGLHSSDQLAQLPAGRN
jgi:hypothetical protein